MSRGATGKVVLDVADSSQLPHMRPTSFRDSSADRNRARTLQRRSDMLQRRMPGLIERYLERLPFARGRPVVTLNEGSTPLVHAPRLSDRVERRCG